MELIYKALTFPNWLSVNIEKVLDTDTLRLPPTC